MKDVSAAYAPPRVRAWHHIGLAMLATAASAKEDSAVAVGNAGKRIVAWVEQAEAGGFSGAVLAAKDGKVVAAVGVGYADLENTTRVTPDTLFEIASASKQITAAAVMVLVQARKLSLDDPIAKHLPGVPENCRAITVRHLLQHTSGIPGSNAEGRGDRIEAVLPSFLAGGPRHEPGTHWEYWNQGYAILSEIVARAAKQDYVEFCAQRLFKPARMRVTRFTGDEAPRGVPVAVGRSAKGAPRSALDHPYGSYGFEYRGMGGVVTNLWDLWRWDRALAGTKVLKDPAKAELFEPGRNDYALGWFVRKDAKGRVVQSHGGSVRGFLTEFRRYPDHDACVVVLANDDGAPSAAVANAVEEILFGGDPKPLAKKAPPLDDDLARAIAGRYESAEGHVLELADGRFAMRWKSPPGAVTPGEVRAGETSGAVRFDHAEGAEEVTCERDPGRPVKALVWRGRRFTRTER